MYYESITEYESREHDADDDPRDWEYADLLHLMETWISQNQSMFQSIETVDEAVDYLESIKNNPESPYWLSVGMERVKIDKLLERMIY